MRRRAGRSVGLVVVAAILAGFSTGPAAADVSSVSVSSGRPAGVGGEVRRSGGGDTSTVTATIADLQRWWGEQFPQVYGSKYVPIPSDRIFASHPGIRLPPCQGFAESYATTVNNAFYCFKDNYISYDDIQLFPQLTRDYGPFAVALVLAHEWGHAIQDRSNNADHPTILKERQADCFAGAWAKHVADGGAKGITLQGGELDASLAALVQFRDAVGSTSTDPQAHGNGFDRTSSFFDGFDKGVFYCQQYFLLPDIGISTEQKFTSQQEATSHGNASNAVVIPASVDLLNDYFTQVEPKYKPLSIKNLVAFDSAGKTSQLPTCGGTRHPRSDYRNQVFFCAPDGYIGYDKPYLDHINKTIGSLGVTTLLGQAWANYVQTLVHFPIGTANLANVLLGQNCYMGGFALAIDTQVLPVPSQGAGYAFFYLSPGDLDKMILAVLANNHAGGTAAKVDFGFREVRAYFRGFNDAAAALAGISSTPLCSSFATAKPAQAQGVSPPKI